MFDLPVFKAFMDLRVSSNFARQGVREAVIPTYMGLIKQILGTLKGSPFSRQMYSELFGLLYSLTRMIRRDGALALESVIGDPHHSPVFQKYPKIHGNHHATEFICTALSMIIFRMQSRQGREIGPLCF